MKTPPFRALFPLALAGSLLALAPVALRAQAPLNFPAPSAAATIKQTVGLTDVEIVYSRPVRRGRTIFGGLVPYDAVWRTGANASTKITFSGPVVFGGTPVPAGTYALYSVPGQSTWQVILSRNTELWGSYGYQADNEAARVSATPVALASPVESFTLSLDDVDDDAATLNLTWERVRVPVKISADSAPVLVPQIEAVMASDAAKKPYFAAAMYYYGKGIHLDQAAQWMNQAAAAQPDVFWLIYRQGLVLEAAGDKAGALAAAEKGLALALQQKEAEVRDEYTRLNQALIARLK